MLRRTVVLTVLATAFAGFAVLGLSAPAQAAVTSSHITSPATGSHYLITNAHPEHPVPVTGTTNGTTGDTVDVRCYFRIDNWNDVATSVAVQADGSFSTTMSTGDPYGTCILRAVPHGWPSGNSLTNFTGPRVTSEWFTSERITSGLNNGKTFDFYVEYQSAHAMNDYISATGGGLWDSRLQYADGTSSNLLWWENAALIYNEEGGTRSSLQVDGHNAFGPKSANDLYSGSTDAPGFPNLTFTASRNAATGTTTIHETDPIVRCSTDTWPATSVSCPSFVSTGVRLERTIVTDDGGRQVHISDVWRSLDHHAHTVSAHYRQVIQGWESSGGFDLPVSLKLPWISALYRTFTSDQVLAGTSHVPGSLFVRDDNTAPNGSTAFPRGAITFDSAITKVHRDAVRTFTLREDGIAVPAGGTRRVRHDYVMGTTEAEIAAKAAASRISINPRRPDGLVKKGSSAYVGDNIYNTTGAGQTVTSRKARGKTATFSVQIQNDGNFTDTFKVKGAAAKKGFTVHYFAGKKDITAAVKNGTYTLRNLAAGQSRTIKLVIKVKGTAKKGALRTWLVTSTSTHDTTSKDTVGASVRVKK